MSTNECVKRLRFLIDEDLVLLSEVISKNPYADCQRWKDVHTDFVKACQKNFSLRSIREHVDHLVKLYIKEDKANLRKSGTEAQYVLKEKLLQNVKDLIEKEKKQAKAKKPALLEEVAVQRDDFADVLIKIEEGEEPTLNMTQSVSEGRVIANDGHEILTGAQTTSSSSPFLRVQKRKWKYNNSSAFNFFEKKQILDREIRTQELLIEERKLNLEEEKLRFERTKMEMSMEIQQRKLNEDERKKAQEDEDRKWKMEKELRWEQVTRMTYEQNYNVINKLLDIISKP